MDYLPFLSWACIVFTVGMFSTGLTDLKKMRETKSTDNIQFLPFLTTCLNNIGWLYYGILKRDRTIVLVNTIGALLQILYIVMYLLYTKQKRQVTMQTLVAGSVLFCGWCYFTVFLKEGTSQLDQLGLTCSVVTVSMYLSPLADLVGIVRSGNVQCLSFPLTVATFFTSTSWVLYGLQLVDYYIVVPNTPGIVTSLIRFYLFWKFGGFSQSSPSYKPLHM
ncbi:sugar transporter SWEET1 [Salarias fasciatus]|uniref:Sugar transporter SWEET1 n=1 Tax=Salarias fasciatus TaxID=181472 RepID=A0A672J9X3_SALFA|nr:sugar transporter SWEET1 [Salarias fasciatus]